MPLGIQERLKLLRPTELHGTVHITILIYQLTLLSLNVHLNFSPIRRTNFYTQQHLNSPLPAPFCLEDYMAEHRKSSG